MKLNYKEIEQIQEALDALRGGSFAQPLILVRAEVLDQVKQWFSLMGFEIMKTGSGDCIRVRNVRDEIPEWSVFHGPGDE